MDLENQEYWKSLINMSLSKFLILRVLYREPSHGYSILEQLKEFTKGCCTPTYGTIYPILKELDQGKYAEKSYEVINNKKRIVYRLTGKGENAYHEALKAWQTVLPYLNKIVEEKR